MALVPGILFAAVEPPNPHLNDHAWNRIQAKTVHKSRFARHVPTAAYFVRPQPISHVNLHPPEEHQTRTALLPPFSVSLSMSITEGMTKATATQTFRNDADQAIDKGKYQFPLPHEASIIDFKCQVGTERVMQGVVKPKSDARNEFESTVSKGRSAGLVEQDSAEIFRTEIGNIPAHTTGEVQISFIFLLKYRLADEITTTILTLPTYIAPRYGSPDFDLEKTGPNPSTSLTLDVNILTSNEIQDVRSDTHQVAIERGIRQRHCQRWADFTADPPASEQPTSAFVKLEGDNACLDKDFVLVISAHPSVNEELPHATLEIHPEYEGSSALMLDIPPAFMLRDQLPMDDREVIFLADRSGSMRDKTAGLMSSMQFFLRGLHSTRFNLYCFGSTYESLWESSQEYGDNTLDEALKYVAGFTNNMGGTELLPALESVIASRGKGSADIIVLTDGEVWRLEETIRLVRRTHTLSEGEVRFFALGIGDAVSHKLVEGIAKAGGGYSEVIPLASTSGWEAQMVVMLKAAMTGHVTDIEIEVEGVALRPKGNPTRRKLHAVLTDPDLTTKPPPIQISPKDISSVSPFQRNRLFILSEESQPHEQSQVKIRRRSIRGQRIETNVPVQMLQEKNSTVHKFAARALLADLDSGASWGSGSDLDLTQKESERLGCKHSLVSNWTSFVAVERDEDKSMETREQAVAISRLGSGDDDLGLLLERSRGSLPRARGPGPFQFLTAESDPAAPSGFNLSTVKYEKKKKSAAASTSAIEFGSAPPLASDAKSSTGRLSTRSKARNAQALVPSFDSSDSGKAPLRPRRVRHKIRRQPSQAQGPSSAASNGQRPPLEGINASSRECGYRQRPDPLDQVSPKRQEHPNLETEPQDYAAETQKLKLKTQVSLIRHFIQFQRADGAFKMTQGEVENLHQVAGCNPDVYAVVEALVSKGSEFDVAVTITLVLILESVFNVHRGMWMLMVEKARAYLEKNMGEDKPELWQVAEEKLSQMNGSAVQADEA